jgi:hypothetical protein
MFSNQWQDYEIQSNSTDSSNTQPSDWQRPKQKGFILSVRVPFAAFCSNLSSGLKCWFHSHAGFESDTSAQKVSFSAFTLLVSELVNFTAKVSCNTFTSLACAPVALTNNIKADLDFSGLQSQISTHIKADVDFRDLLCQSFNNIESSSDFSNFKHQLFITDEAYLNISQFLSSILQLNKTSSTFQMVTNKHKCVIKIKMPSTFQSIVGSKQKYLRKPQQDLVDVWLLNAILNVNLQTANNF